MNRTEMDYYSVLNVPRSASKEEITLAYRKLAVRICPHRDLKHKKEFVPLADAAERSHLEPLSSHRQWEYINMAFDVLGNDLRRTIYDRFGEAGLFQGIMLPNGYFPPYLYHGDHMKVYHEVFGSYSPYANLIDSVTNPPVLFSTVKDGIGVRTKDSPVEKLINLTLEEVRAGSVKLMNVWRQEFVDSKQTVTEKRKKTLTLNIKPGTTPGTRYTFVEEGDRSPMKIPADIVFITADIPHEIYQRRNHFDLAYVHKISLRDALIGFQFSVPTLDRRELKISITEVVYPGLVKIIPCEGLPKCVNELSAMMSKKNQQKLAREFGDLKIEFEIIFPRYLNSELKADCREFFAKLSEMEDREQGEAQENPLQKYMKA